MNRHYWLIRAVVVLAASGLLAACSMQQLTQADAQNVKGMPGWVMEGTQVVKNDDRRAIHGVKMAALAELSAQRPFNSYESNPQPRVPWWSHMISSAQMAGYSNEVPPIGAATLGNINVQGLAADQRARAEVAKVLVAVMQQLASNPLAPGARGLDEGRARTQDIINEMLKDVKIVARWRDEQSNFLYSLAELDIGQASGRMQYVAGLDPELRGHIETEMEQVFDVLADNKIKQQPAQE